MTPPKSFEQSISHGNLILDVIKNSVFWGLPQMMPITLSLLVLLLLFLAALLLLVSPLIVGVYFLAGKKTNAGLVILGIYMTLVLTFVVYGEAERRSTPGKILRWIKGESGLEQRTNDFAEDTEKVINPSELQQWAVTTLQSPQQTNWDTDFPKDKVPADIKNLKSGNFTYEFIMCDSKSVLPQKRSICIVWGGGFGHWGIRVGPPSFKVDPKTDENYYVEWKPGIYFWCERH